MSDALAHLDRAFPSIAHYDTLTGVPVTNDAALASLELTARSLRLPTVKRVRPRLADQATRRHQTHLDFLAAVLLCEVDDHDERRRLRRVKAAGFPRTELLADFDIRQSTSVDPPPWRPSRVAATSNVAIRWCCSGIRAPASLTC